MTASAAMPALLALGSLPGVVIASGQDEAGAGAAFSLCERYRYALWRVWNPGAPFWTFGMLNPSTADHLKLDPTLTRCASRAAAGGAGGMIIWNLFAWRATDPADMKRAVDPVGPANDAVICRVARLGALNVAGWGVHGTHLNRQNDVCAMLDREEVAMRALGFTKDGHPRHPLYIQNQATLQPFVIMP